MTGASDLYFENDNQNNVVLKVFDDFGDVIYLEQTSTNKFVLDSTHFSSGMYYFSLENQKHEMSLMEGCYCKSIKVVIIISIINLL